MENEKIHLLLTIDRNYVMPFRVMLKSFIINNPQEAVHLWLLYSDIPQDDLNLLTEYCNAQRVTLTAIQVDRTIFKDAPVSKRYPQEMYYRLLAPFILPDSVDRILYLDPDILVINSVRPLWETQLENYAFAAAAHSVVPDMVEDVNKIRLNTDHAYFNTGVILMDLGAVRKLVNTDDLFEYVRKHSTGLLLPDQDVFNCLCGAYAKQIDDTVWNYDARRFSAYKLNSGGKCTMDWIMQNTVFCTFVGNKSLGILRTQVDSLRYISTICTLRRGRRSDLSKVQLFCLIREIYQTGQSTRSRLACLSIENHSQGEWFKRRVLPMM